MQNIAFNCYKWILSNKNLFYILIILLVLTRFFYLNYLNWNYGTLCTGYGGIQYGCDANRYIEGAENLIHNKGILGYRKAYLGYMVIIAFGQICGFGLEFTLVIQIIATLLSSIALYDLAKSITNSKAAGIIGAGFYLVNPFIVTWVLFIHTESLYASLLILSAWAINKAIQKQNINYYFLLLLIVFITTTIRPNGWVVIPLSFIFLIQYSKINGRLKFFTWVSILIIFIAIMNNSPWFSKKSDLEKVSQLIVSGKIICDPETYHLSMPEETFSHKNDLSESLIYIVKHPIAFGKLAILRIGSELLPIYRPWLTVEFILRFLLWMLPAYIFTIIGSIFFRKQLGLKIVLAIIFAHLLIIALTFSEREFRFLIHFLPLFHLVAGCGLYIILKKVTLKVFNKPLSL
jgi:4-amino-4-deoxy-L-arabinose transferase-like glycosyltransferase